jgi:hypothetical protein
MRQVPAVNSAASPAGTLPPSASTSAAQRVDLRRGEVDAEGGAAGAAAQAGVVGDGRRHGGSTRAAAGALRVNCMQLQ